MGSKQGNHAKFERSHFNRVKVKGNIKGFLQTRKSVNYVPWTCANPPPKKQNKQQQKKQQKWPLGCRTINGDDCIHDLLINTVSTWSVKNIKFSIKTVWHRCNFETQARSLKVVSWRRCEWVELNEYYHHAKFDIYHISGVWENPNIKSFCPSRPASLTPIIIYTPIFHVSQKALAFTCSTCLFIQHLSHKASFFHLPDQFAWPKLLQLLNYYRLLCRCDSVGTT